MSTIFATKDDDDSTVVTCPSVLSPASDDSSVTTTSSKDTKFQSMNDGFLRFTSQASIPSELEPIYHHLKPQWDSGPVVIAPSYKHNSSSHLLDTKLILRQAKYQSFVANGTVEPQVFPVLIDTGCSVACTGFQEDFD